MHTTEEGSSSGSQGAGHPHPIKLLLQPKTGVKIAKYADSLNVFVVIFVHRRSLSSCMRRNCTRPAVAIGRANDHCRPPYIRQNRGTEQVYLQLFL
jgi:hypothetical protein